MRCQLCGYEGECKYCPNCGIELIKESNPNNSHPNEKASPVEIHSPEVAESSAPCSLAARIESFIQFICNIPWLLPGIAGLLFSLMYLASVLSSRNDPQSEYFSLATKDIILSFITMAFFSIGCAEVIAFASRYSKKQKRPMRTVAINTPHTDPFILIDAMDGHQFEYFCAELLKKNGYYNVEVTQGSGDCGIDVLAEKEGITFAIQCKCYSGNIGNHAVQEAYSGTAYYKRQVPVVMTNRYFTPAAKDTAQKTNVLLWDRDQLLRMIK